MEKVSMCYKRRFIAVLIAFCMIAGSVIVPELSVCAATIDRAGDSGVTADIANSNTPSAEWSEFSMNLTNSTGQTICDWVAVLKVADGINTSGFQCWNSTFVRDGQTIYLYPMKDKTNAVLQPGTMSGYQPGFGFGGVYVIPGNITVEKIYYNYGSTSTEDYSGGTSNDDSGESGGGSGTGVNIPAGTLTDYNYSDIEYNYAKLLQYALYFYDANMCGEDVSEKSALDWRGNCHTYDIYI